jgi:predicted nuclease with TOPRIM domain
VTLRHHAGAAIDGEIVAHREEARRVDEMRAASHELDQQLKAALSHRATLDARIQQLEQERARLEQEQSCLIASNELLRRQGVWSPLWYATAVTQWLRRNR